jgi:hypothetical protein
MKFDHKGIRTVDNRINDFEKFLYSVKDNSLWKYNGLIVEIDPTVDYGSSNVLIRWVNIDECFNDKVIYYNLAEFKKDFKLLG